MSKELEALKRLKTYFENNCVNDWEYNDDFNYKDDLDIIETAFKEYKELKKIVKQQINTIGYYENLALKNKLESDKKLKALEIIKEKRVNVHLLILSDSLEKYNYQILPYRKLTQEEYEFLKEMLE